jgi:hypothetical protein
MEVVLDYRNALRVEHSGRAHAILAQRLSQMRDFAQVA